MRANEFLTEATLDINDDVDMLYDYFFAELIDDIINGEWDGKLYAAETDTDQLMSPICQKANDVNHCDIWVNHEGHSNYYQPTSGVISISLNQGALDVYRWYKKNAVNMTGEEGNRLRLELTPAIVKGSIHHELSHWIRDSLHKNISPLIAKAKEAGRNTVLPAGQEINAHALERDSQIHNVVQLKREYGDAWDHMSFNQLIATSPALNSTYKNMPMNLRPQWVRQIRARMAREGLLGKNMTGPIK